MSDMVGLRVEEELLDERPVRFGALGVTELRAEERRRLGHRPRNGNRSRDARAVEGSAAVLLHELERLRRLPVVRPERRKVSDGRSSLAVEHLDRKSTRLNS